jgi:hypothetical protein
VFFLFYIFIFILFLVDKRGAARTVAETTNDFQPPEFVLPNIKEIPIMPLHLNGIKTKV